MISEQVASVAKERIEVAIIGDDFMLPEIFADKLRQRCRRDVLIRMQKNNWPNEPMQNGYAGLREYLGEPEQVVEFIGSAEILITHLAPMSREVMQQLPALKLIVVSRGGPVNIDMAAAKELGIKVVSVPGRNASAVAEFTIGAILVETRKIREGHEALRQGNWRGDLYRADTTGRELSELTVGLIGYGEIGQRVVQLLKPFGCQINVCDPYVNLSESDQKDGVVQCDLKNLLKQSDVVSLHARVTDETLLMMNADTFAQMKPDALFINTARGPLCDYPALYEALKDKRLGGAMLETFDQEPPDSDSPLLQLPNLTMTPHIAGASVKTISYSAEKAADAVFGYRQAKLAECEPQ